MKIVKKKGFVFIEGKIRDISVFGFGLTIKEAIQDCFSHYQDLKQIWR